MEPTCDVPVLYELGTNPQPPYESIGDFQFSSGTLVHLERFKYDQLTNLDFSVAANIAIGNDCVIVAEDDRNKVIARRVLAYLLPILKDLTDKPFERPRPAGSVGRATPVSGCEALLICASKTSGRQTEKVAQFLRDCVCPSRGSLSSNVEVAYSDDLRFISKKNPTVLITDMESLQLMRGVSKAAFLFARLKYLVFEEQERYSELQHKEISQLIAIAEQHNEKYGTSPFTTVFATSQWTGSMETLFTHIRFKMKRNIVAYFYHTIELVKFANVNFNLLTFAIGGSEDDDRFKLLNGILTKGFGTSHSKVAICCGTVDKAHMIQSMCVGMNFDAKIAGFVNRAVGTRVSPGAPEIIIIPDWYFCSPGTKGCTYLIGFDGDSLKQIHYMTDSFPQLNPETKQIERKNLIMQFLVTGQEANFLSLYKFAKSLNNATISDELETVGGAMVNQELSRMPLCGGINLFGYCNSWTGSKCHLRHEFIESDVQAVNVVPCHGKIEFKVIRCKSPSEYICLLLNFRKSSSDPVERSYVQEREEYLKALNKLAGKEQLQAPPRYENGETYAVFDRFAKTYRLGKLLLRPGESANSKFVNFECMVSGTCFGMGIDNNVFLLPRKLLQWKPLPPPPLVKIILCGVRPRESTEMEYSARECRIAQNLTNDRTYKAYVGLSISDTIYARTVLYSRSSNDVAVKDGCLRTLLLAKEIVSLNPFHLGVLLDLVRKLGDTYPDHVHLSRYDNGTHELYHNYEDQVYWRHVELSSRDSIKLVDIKATYVYDPWCFYGICSEFEQLLNNLEGGLTKWASENNVYEIYNVSKTKFLEQTVKVSSVIAVKIRNEDNDGFSWKRGLVVGIHGDGQDVNSMSFEIFLVDFGETLYNVAKDDVAPILKKFVDVLPFQAITFSLDHIKPVGEGTPYWDQAAKEAFWRILVPDGYNTYFKAVVYQDVTDDKLYSRYYHVIGMYKNLEIGDMMVKLNMAVEHMDIKEWVGRIKQAVNQAALALMEGENDDSSAEEFFDACETLDEYDVNLETHRNLISNPVEETVKKLELKIKEIKLQRRISFEDSHLNGNAIPATSAQKSIFPIRKASGIPTIPATSAQNLIFPIRKASGIPQVKSILKKKRSSKSKKKKRSSPVKAQPQSPTVSAQPQYLQMKHPEVLWHQTRTQVILTVIVADVKKEEYSVKIDNSSFVSVQIIQPQDSYRFHIQLIGKVTGWAVQLLGQQLKISLDKLNPTEEGWPRLLWDKHEKPRWLKFNKDYLKEDDDDEGGENGCKALVPMHGAAAVDKFEYGEDNDESLHEIEEEKFFQVPTTSKFNRPDSIAILMEDDDFV